MGIDRQGAKFLFWARSEGVNFERALTIGRHVFFLSKRELHSVLSANGIIKSSAELDAIFTEAQGYADPFLRLLGCLAPASLDASDYEGATHVHDLNQPVPEAWQQQYSAVFDGGSLEHVFNFPQAIRNCMEMVKVGGHFLAITPANNFMGHGFYQFSPDLFARVFSADNGFALEHMIIFELESSRWYEVMDPAKAMNRVSLINRTPTCLGIVARKLAHVPLFTQAPQQSDYIAKWAKGVRIDPAHKQRTPWYRKALRRMKRLVSPRFNPRHYRPIDV